MARFTKEMFNGKLHFLYILRYIFADATEICSKLNNKDTRMSSMEFFANINLIKAVINWSHLKRSHLRRSGVFIVDLE